MTDVLTTDEAETFVFGIFEFNRRSRQLRRNGAPLRLRPRELDLLEVLIEHAGNFVSDRDLMESAWRTSDVSEITLRVQMAGLQRVLSESPDRLLGPNRHSPPFIQFKQGAGYRFEGAAAADPRGRSGGNPADKLTNLPVRQKILFGRERVLSQLRAIVSRDRLVTLVADSGTGKTAVSLALCDALVPSYRDGVWLVDLAGLTEASLVVDTLIATLGIPIIAAAPKAELITWLASKELVLLLDNCEQVKAAVASLVSELLEEAPLVRFIATSRVPLGVVEETVFDLPPLAVPPQKALTADIAISFPAVAFLLDNLRSLNSPIDLDINNVRLIIQLCQSLNGNPLAIELAAAQMGLLGAASLTTPPDVLASVALEIAAIWRRQDTGLAMLEWCYDGLSENAQLLLVRLSVCRREFTAAAAVSIAADIILSEPDLSEALEELVSRSLVKPSESSSPPTYHMLVLVRDFAWAKLQASRDAAPTLRRHAQNCLKWLKRSGSDLIDQSHAASIDDIRAAVDWCFSDQGDAITGTRLISLTVGNRKTLYGIQDYARLLDKALARYEELHVVEPDLELRLIVERMCLNQHGANDQALMARLKDRAYELAKDAFTTSGDPANLLAINLIAFSLSFSAGNGPEKRRYAREMELLATQVAYNTEIEVLSARMSAQAHHYMGEHHLALPLIKRVMNMSDQRVQRRVSVPGDRVDPRITLAIFNARTTWLLGSPERATAEAVQLVETVRANWDYILCYVIAFSSLPISIWRGDLASARGQLQDLQTRAADFRLDYWTTWADFYARTLAFFESGGLRPSDQIDDFEPNPMHIDFMGTFHEGLLTQSAVDRVEAGLVGWCAPEIIRIDAVRAMSAGTLTATEGEAQLQRALDLAVRQDALAWQLRITTSLGRLWRYQGKSVQARALLTKTLGGFSEGFGDTDLVSATALLKDL